jgi:hypothetical protein
MGSAGPAQVMALAGVAGVEATAGTPLAACSSRSARYVAGAGSCDASGVSAGTWVCTGPPAERRCGIRDTGSAERVSSCDVALPSCCAGLDSVALRLDL